MTHPSIPLEQTPVFAGMLNDPNHGELARELLQGSSGSFHATFDGLLTTHIGYLNHPENCLACQPTSLAFSVHSPRPPRDDRHLAICAAPATDPSRLEPVRTPGRRSRPKKTAVASSHHSTKGSH